MSEKILRAMREGVRNVEKYTPMIEDKLRKAGTEINPTLVYFAAMNYPALNKLAQE
jgi:hypothetical protein